MLRMPDRRPGAPTTEGGPGQAMRLVAARLAACGLEVRLPEHADSRRLAIISARCARSELTVADCGQVTWEYWPWSGPRTDPAQLTALVLRLLGGAVGASTGPSGPRAHLTLKGIIGCELEARGLHVTLEVFEDLIAYDVAASIAVTSPARPRRGRVWVADEGSLTWDCQCTGPASQQAETIAEAIAPILTQGTGAATGTNRQR